MPTSPKKPASKQRTKAVPKTANGAGHPSWVDMIKDCIASHPEDARNGVSRPAIKKFVENKYRIELTATTATQLNRAITAGSDKGIFVLPKGASGKVKLAPKRSRTDAAKENAKPPSKRSTTVKAPPARAAVAKAKVATMTAKTSSKKPTTARVVKSKSAAAKKAVGSKKTATRRKVAAANKAGARKKAPSARKGAVKKTAVGETRKTRPKAAAKGKGV